MKVDDVLLRMDLLGLVHCCEWRRRSGMFPLPITAAAASCKVAVGTGALLRLSVALLDHVSAGIGGGGALAEAAER